MASPTTLEPTPSPSESGGNEQAVGERLPECLTRDNLTSEYFPQTSRGLLACIAVLCLVFLLISIHRLNHTDLWGHLNFGRWIVAEGQLPAADPFTAAEASKPFVNVPWLAQVAGYLTWRLAGAEGLVLAHAGLITVACGLVMIAIARRGVELPWAAAGGAASLLLALPIVGTIRPQLFGMVGVALVLVALSIPRKDRLSFPLGRAAGLAALFAIWANLHGSFAIGLVLLGLQAVAATIPELLGGRRHPENDAEDLSNESRRGPAWRKLAAAWSGLGAALLGSCLNPLGPWLLLEVASFGGHVPLEAISEWQRLTPWSLSGGLFFGSLIATVAILRAAGRRMNLLEMLLLAAFGLLTLTAMRMLVWWALVWPWVLAPYAEAAWSRLVGTRREPAPSAMPREASMRTLIALALIFTTLLLAPPTHALLLDQPRGPARVLREETPIYLAGELQRRQLAGSLLAPMDWADYLVWKTDARVRPLVYSHVHLISAAVWNDYRRILAGDPQWRELARRHDVRYLAVDRRRSRELARETFLQSQRPHSGIRLIYQDQTCILVELLAEAGGKKAGVS